MSEKKSSPLFGIGSVTLLTVLLVLCLTIFAVLALSSAQADLRLSEKSAQAAQAYYAANSQGMELMATATALWESGAKPAAGTMEQQLQQTYGDEVFVADEGAGLVIFADLRVQENQLLQLELSLAAPGAAERWTIHQWQVMAESGGFIEFDSLPVWTGEDIVFE